MIKRFVLVFAIAVASVVCFVKRNKTVIHNFGEELYYD